LEQISNNVARGQRLAIDIAKQERNDAFVDQSDGYG
jgi:hypothetical protein